MKQPVANGAAREGCGGLIERRNYLIDRFPVSFQGGASWHCQCREFTLANSCRHTREASGMRDAQAKIANRAPGGSTALQRAPFRIR